jgi:acyl dehydratase
VGQLFAPSMLTLTINAQLTHGSRFFEIATVTGLGIDEVRMSKPVLIDDQLQVKLTMVSKRDSQSKSGLGVMTNKIEVINQRRSAAIA